MRLWQILVMVIFVAVGFTLSRDPVGRVSVIVFVFGLFEVVVGVLAIKTLFQTIGSIGRAETLVAYAHAVMSTAIVVVVGSVTMAGILYLGARLLQAAVN